MKKVILGSMMMVAGLISAAVLLAGSMANDWTINGEFSSFWNLSQYGLMPFSTCFLGLLLLVLRLQSGASSKREIENTDSEENQFGSPE